MDYLVFKRFIARGLVMVAWWVGVIGITYCAVTLSDIFRLNLPPALVFLGWILAQVIWRLTCEVMTVQFSINEHLSNIEKKLQSIQSDDKSSTAKVDNVQTAS